MTKKIAIESEFGIIKKETHAKEIQAIVEKWRKKFHVLECYWEIPVTRIDANDRDQVIPSLGPSFFHADT